jgi:predicted nucleic acid-binding protein
MRPTFSGNWGVDSNIIIYALDRKSVFFKKAEAFFNQAKGINFYITQQNLVEIEKVIIGFYRIKKETVITNLERFLSAFNFSIISPLPTTLSYYHKLLLFYPAKDAFFDLYLVATYLDNQINNFFTVNTKDFLTIKELRVVNPFSYF